MPQGDAVRQWFPEMGTILREQYYHEITWPELTLLAERLDTTLQQIRMARSVAPPMHTCRKCGVRGRAKFGRISVNAVIFATARYHLATEADMKEMSRRWKKYRKENGLDLYGRPNSPQDPIVTTGG